MSAASPRAERRRPAGAVALLLASVLWGTTGTAAHLMPASVGPLAIGACTMTIGGILLFLVAVRPSVRAIADRRARPWLLRGAVGVVVYPLAFYPAMDLAGVAIGNVVALGSGPVFAALFEWLGERRPVGVRAGVASGTAIVGVVVLGFGGAARGPGASTGSDGSVVPGVLLALVAGAAYALYAYSSSRVIATGQPARAAMGGMFGIGAVGLLPVLLVFGAPILQSASAVGIAAYLAIGPMFIAYVLFGVGIARIRSSAATTITLLEPVVATALAVVVVGERPTALGWVGLALILAGVTIVATARRPGNPEAWS